MWSAEATAHSTATLAQLWSVWADVERWSAWDSSVVSSSLNGPFAAGTTGRISPRRAPPGAFVLSEVSAPTRFVSVSRLPLAWMTFVHEAEPEGGGVRIVHRVEITGPLSRLFGRLIGGGIERDLRHAVTALAATASARGGP